MDWRAAQRWVPVDGHAVNAIDVGEGPVVVLVHGLSGNWQNWLEVIPRLIAAGHRVVVFSRAASDLEELFLQVTSREAVETNAATRGSDS